MVFKKDIVPSQWGRLFTLGLATVIVAIVAAACGGGDSTSSSTTAADEATTVAESSASESTTEAAESTTEAAGSSDLEPAEIEVASFYPEGNVDAEFFNVVNDAFAVANPGSSAKIWYYGDPSGAAQDQRLRAGTPPEVLHFAYTPNTESAGYERAKTGQLYDLSDAMDGPVEGYDGSWKDSILPAALPFITFPETGAIVAAPRELTVVQIFYNAKMFRELGIEPPTTWDELLAAAQTVKDAGITPITVTGQYNISMQYWYEYLLLRLGGGDAAQAAIDGEGEFKDVPGALEAAQKVAELRERGFLLEGFEGTDILQSQIAFFSGKAAMILMGSWLVAEMAGQIPDDFELATIPFPSLGDPAGDDGDVYGFVNTMSVAAESAHPELGVEWLRAFSSKAVQTERVEELGYISGMRDVPAPAGYEGIVEALQSAKLRVYGLGVFQSSPAELQDAYAAQVVRLFYGEITPEQFVDEVNTRLNAYWAAQ